MGGIILLGPVFRRSGFFPSGPSSPDRNTITEQKNTKECDETQISVFNGLKWPVKLGGLVWGAGGLIYFLICSKCFYCKASNHSHPSIKATVSEVCA